MDVPLSVRIASEIPWVSMAPSSASRLAWPLLERPPWPRHGSGSEGDLGHQALATEADHMKLAPGDQLIRRRPGRFREARRPRRRCRRGDRQVSVGCGWMWSWTPHCAVDVHKNVHKNVHSWNFFKSLCLPPMARAVKGGEAEAPDVSAPSLEGPESHP